MTTTSLTGADTSIINDRVLVDLGDGDVTDITYPDDLVGVKTGKNGNTLYALNESGRRCECKIRVVLGSSDDKFLNNLMQSMTSDFAAFELLTGQFVKRCGDGAGNVTRNTYSLAGGVFKKRVEAKSNTDGDTNQSVAEYSFTFGNGDRVIA